MALQLDDLTALDAPMPNTSGTPLLIELDRVDEDPEQPRREFDEDTLQALAETVRERGVRQPISVRPSATQPGRWVLNFGARRLRAARMAGHAQIPAFVDTTADRYDQVIENEQREGLRPLELAMFVQKRLGLGESQAEIARKLGKSRQWVAQATAMIDPPDWLMQVYREGRCRGLNELNELRRLHAGHPQAVEQWLVHQGSVTRDRLQELRGGIEARRSPAIKPVERSELPAVGAAATTTATSPAAAALEVAARTPRPAVAPAPPAVETIDLRIHLDLEGQEFILVVTATPIEAGHVDLVPASGGPRRAVPVDAIRLRGFVAR